jgi:hypothetical protein
MVCVSVLHCFREGNEKLNENHFTIIYYVSSVLQRIALSVSLCPNTQLQPIHIIIV